MGTRGTRSKASGEGQGPGTQQCALSWSSKAFQGQLSLIYSSTDLSIFALDQARIAVSWHWTKIEHPRTTSARLDHGERESRHRIPSKSRAHRSMHQGPLAEARSGGMYLDVHLHMRVRARAR